MKEDKEQQMSRPINFMKLMPLYFLLSALVIIPGLISLLRFGLQPAIDFSGGSLFEFRIDDRYGLSEEEIWEAEPEGVELSTVQSAGENDYIVRSKPMTSEQKEAFRTNLAQLATGEETVATPAAVIDELRFETVGPTLGRELLNKTLVSVFLAAGVILMYMAYRFKELKFGITGVMAMFHDSLILLGIFSILGYLYGVEVDTLFVTAVLTTLSFSVHDTIVVYDRIRESLRRYPGANFTDIVNQSVGETLARSINNSMTIIFMLLALWLMGGETTRWFVFALLIGTIAGTYSSTFTAAPLLVLWERLWGKKKKTK